VKCFLIFYGDPKVYEQDPDLHQAVLYINFLFCFQHLIRQKCLIFHPRMSKLIFARIYLKF